MLTIILPGIRPVFGILLVCVCFACVEPISAQRRLPRRWEPDRNSNQATQDRKTGKLSSRGKAALTLEVYFGSGDPLGQQKWGKLLSEVGADSYFLRSSRSSVTTDVQESQIAGRKAYRVKGVVDGNKLHLPGGSFTLREKAGIAEHLAKIRADGPETALAEKMAFGLTSTQLVSVGESLAAPHGISTRGKVPRDIVPKIAERIEIPLKMDAGVRRKIEQSEDKILDELKTLSCGTTLAAVLRPLGLVAVPTRETGQEIELVVADSRSASEHWPVGWPIEGSNAAAVPKMFERQDAEIENFKLKKVLDIIEKTCQVPFVYDQNSFARHGADMDATRVTLIQSQQAYYVVVSKILGQSRPQLKQEVRLDEAGKAFLWITTMRR